MAVQLLTEVSAIRTTRQTKRAYARAAAREGIRLSEWLRRQADRGISEDAASRPARPAGSELSDLSVGQMDR